MTGGYLLATNGQTVCFWFANLQERQFSIHDTNNMHAMIDFRPCAIRLELGLPRLSRSLFFSLIFHASIAIWLGETPQGDLKTGYFGTQSLQITLNAPNKGASIALRSDAAPVAPASFPDPSVSVAEEANSTLFPLPQTHEQIYVAPEDVEEMAFVVNVSELPLPSDEQTPNGTLSLKILISETGHADRIDVVTSSLPDDYAATLIKSFYQATFSPARMAGFPVRSWRIIEIRFGDAEPASS